MRVRLLDADLYLPGLVLAREAPEGREQLLLQDVDRAGLLRDWPHSDACRVTEARVSLRHLHHHPDHERNHEPCQTIENEGSYPRPIDARRPDGAGGFTPDSHWMDLLATPRGAFARREENNNTVWLKRKDRRC
jgi:hypothetical protein